MSKQDEKRQRLVPMLFEDVGNQCVNMKDVNHKHYIGYGNLCSDDTFGMFYTANGGKPDPKKYVLIADMQIAKEFLDKNMTLEQGYELVIKRAKEQGLITAISTDAEVRGLDAIEHKAYNMRYAKSLLKEKLTGLHPMLYTLNGEDVAFGYEEPRIGDVAFCYDEYGVAIWGDYCAVGLNDVIENNKERLHELLSPCIDAFQKAGVMNVYTPMHMLVKALKQLKSDGLLKSDVEKLLEAY